MWLMSLEERCSRYRWRSDRCDQWYLGASMSRGPRNLPPRSPACQPAPLPAPARPVPRASPRRSQGQPAPGFTWSSGVHLVITVRLVGPSPWHCQL